MNPLFLLFGILFGFLLSRARATEYDVIVGMFRFTDLHLAGVMAVAIAVAAAGLYLLRRAKAAIDFQPKPPHRWMWLAGLVFGTGWALTGA